MQDTNTHEKEASTSPKLATPPINKGPKLTVAKTPIPAIKKPERSTDDLGDDIVTGAALADTVADVAGDDGDECLTFILGLAAAGVVLSYLGLKSNPGNETVQLGVYIYWAGYAVLLTRIIPWFLIIGGFVGLYMNIFEGKDLPYEWIIGGIGAGALILLIRYLIPKNIMSIIQKVSWVLMFVGPAIMISGGADKTGPLCMVVSFIWLLIFAFAAAVSAIFSKLSGN